MSRRSRSSGIQNLPTAPAQAEQKDAHSSRIGRLARIGLAFVLLATVASYLPSIDAPFVFDDLTSIADNATIRRLWPLSVPLSPPSGTGTTVDGRPLLNLSFAFNYAIGGLDVRGYHVANLAIHLAAGLLLFGIVHRALAMSGWGSSTARLGSRPSPALVALGVSGIWLLHPLQTAAVTYTSRRAETLAALFILLSLYAFIRATATPRGRIWEAMAVVSCAAGMATKETAAMAPVLILLFDRVFVAGTFVGALRRRWRLHAGLAATWILLLWLLLDTGNRGGTAGLGTAVSSWSYALTQAGAIVRYLGLVIWPHPLVFDYGTPLASDVTPVLPQLVLLGILILVTLVGFRHAPKPAFVGASFFLLLAPSSSIIPVATQTVAEHRMYLPLAGVVALVIPCVFAWMGNRSIWSAFVLAVPLGILTASRNADYASELSLWSDTVAKCPGNPRAHNALGRALAREARTDEAIAAFGRAIELDPAGSEARANLGSALVEAGRLDQALEQLTDAVRLAPESFSIQASLGNALHLAGRLEEAITHLETAMRLAPNEKAIQGQLCAARLALGNRLARGRRLEAAAEQFEEIIRIQPDHVEARNNLGNVLMLQRRPAEAIPHYEAALKLQPSAMTHANLAAAFLLNGSPAEAVAHYRASLALDPDYAPARSGLRHAESRLRSPVP